MKFLAFASVASANLFDTMGEDQLLAQLQVPSDPLNNLKPEVMVTPPLPRPPPSRTSKRLSARILKRLDDGQPLVEVARKMKAIEGMQPQINDMERRLGIMQSVEPVLENAIKTLQKVVDVRGMGKKTRYHAIRRASPRERHQDPPKGRRCQ